MTAPAETDRHHERVGSAPRTLREAVQRYYTPPRRSRLSVSYPLNRLVIRPLRPQKRHGGT
jgi:hypothetical protein